MDIDSAPVKGVDKMDVEDEKKEVPKDKKDSDDKDAASADSKKKPEKEKIGFDIENMCRVLPGQLKYVSFPSGRYKPVKKVRTICSFVTLMI
jgi:26S proteasome regulatory subunit N2